jgi:hypothetical protein
MPAIRPPAHLPSPSPRVRTLADGAAGEHDFAVCYARVG